MDGTRVRKSQPRTLAVLQEFVGGRLERQLWSRAYELVTPAGRVMVGKMRLLDPAEPSARTGFATPTFSKGA